MSRKPKKVNTVVQRYKAKEPTRKNMARALFFLNAFFWLGYVVYIYYDMAVLNNNKSSADIATIFTFVNAIALFASGVVLGKAEDTSYYFALVVLAMNFILTILNLADNFFLISFILDVVILWLLFQLRKTYLPIK